MIVVVLFKVINYQYKYKRKKVYVMLSVKIYKISL